MVFLFSHGLSLRYFSCSFSFPLCFAFIFLFLLGVAFVPLFFAGLYRLRRFSFRSPFSLCSCFFLFLYIQDVANGSPVYRNHIIHLDQIDNEHGAWFWRDPWIPGMVPLRITVQISFLYRLTFNLIKRHLYDISFTSSTTSMTFFEKSLKHLLFLILQRIKIRVYQISQ